MEIEEDCSVLGADAVAEEVAGVAAGDGKGFALDVILAGNLHERLCYSFADMLLADVETSKRSLLAANDVHFAMTFETGIEV